MIIEGVAFLLWLCIFINLGALIGKLIIIWKDRIERAKEQQLTNSEGKE